MGRNIIKEEYLVDIPMCAYKHEKYIEEAILGVLNQQTAFKYRLIIGEDCSPDGTRAIIEKYLAKFPDKMKVFFHEKNLGAHANSRILFNACTSKYIALCDGDDYWTDPLKLQKQIDFMEGHPDFSICFHNVKLLYSDGSKVTEDSGAGQKEVSTFEDLTFGNFINTASCVFRNTITQNLPEWFDHISVGDWTLHFLNAQFGKIYHINETMAVYRINPGSTWANQSSLVMYQRMIALLKIYEEKFDEKYKMLFKRRRSHFYMQIADEYHKQSKKLKEIFYFYKACVSSDLYNMNIKDIIHKVKTLYLN